MNIAEEIIAKSLSVRQTESLVKKILEVNVAKKSALPKGADRDIQILEEEVSRILGTRVAIENKNNKGKLIVEYYSLDDLDRILGVIRK